MKTDLVTSIGASVLGVIVAFLICNTLLPEIEPASFKRLDQESESLELTEPDPEVFNYRALNPTVEVYVGDCDEYDEYGNCITQEDKQQVETEENEDSGNYVTETLEASEILEVILPDQGE